MSIFTSLKNIAASKIFASTWSIATLAIMSIGMISWGFSVGSISKNKNLDKKIFVENSSSLPPIIIDLIKDTLVCAGSDITFSPVISGGTPPFTYMWVGPNGFSANTQNITISNVTSAEDGNYQLQVTDSGAPAEIERTEVYLEVLELELEARVEDVLCAGDGGGIRLKAWNGKIPYTYLWSNGSTDQNPTGLTPGTYTVTVSDATVCTATAEVIMTEPPAIQFDTTITNITCNGSNNGQIDLTVSGGRLE